MIATALQLYSSYLNLSDQDISDGSQHSHKVKHIPRCFQVVLKNGEDAEIRLHGGFIQNSKSSVDILWGAQMLTHSPAYCCLKP